MTTGLYEIEVNGANGAAKKLSDYKGDILLIVNVASRCGFTPQYTGLEALYRSYKDRGFRVLAFPSNDFGGQEPGTMEEIQSFCQLNYDVSFELLEKVHAIGEDKHPVYAHLTGETEDQGDVKWNFEKFLISRDGQVIGRYSSKVAPQDEELVQAIEAAL